MAGENNRVDGDLYVGGTLRVGTDLSAPAGCLKTTNWSATAGDELEASKCDHFPNYSGWQSGTAADEEVIIGIVKFAGSIKQVDIGNITDCVGSSAVTVDILVNGVSCLAAAVTLDSSTGNRGTEAGTISSATVAAGDVISANIVTAASGTDALAVGVYAQVKVDEGYAS